MAAIGHPLLGDDLYGGSRELIKRQALHAYRVIFKHPIENKRIDISIPLPSDMAALS
jgi:23S rRNA pseudouridine1911/1915/1917 synthase